MTDGTVDFSENRVARWEVLDAEIKQQLREDVEELVEKYHTLMERGELSEQSEEDVKVKFLNPLLESLGWDVRGIDEVKFEQRTLSGRTDFGLRTSRDAKPSIFYELKSFDESLDGTRKRHGDKMSYAEVAIEDAWQMKVDWAVLTNFEEFRLYYTHVDSPDEGLVAEWSLKDPPGDEELEQLWDLSKPRIKQGSLAEYDRRRTRQPITDEVVDDLYDIRTTLSHDIREHNDLSTEELRESVQRILDRLVVIRTAEDRGIISPGSLETIVESWDETKIDSSVRTLMRDLRNLFRDFDAVYNSELFAEHQCEQLDIDNDTLKDVIRTLYEYNFDLIDADILGSIYEDYLGHVLEEQGESVDIVEEREHRQDEGIYYTPPSIVRYCVQHAVGDQVFALDDPEEVEEFHVVDPSCGSGSFLIQAYDYLYEWYTEYNESVHDQATQNSGLDGFEDHIPDPENRVINQNLYGVDLDDQAVEIASVNLMLKALRPGEKLPLIMGENLKQGNSLVFDPDEENGFDWWTAFNGIFNGETGGFDAVIGNPPWGAEVEDYEEFLEQDGNYELAAGQYDSYELFIELATEILAPGGRLAFVIPDSIFNEEHEALRELLAENTKILKLIKLGEGFFDVYRAATIVVFENTEPEDDTDHMVDAAIVQKPDRKKIKDGVKSIQDVEDERGFQVPQQSFLDSDTYAFDLVSQYDEQILGRMEEDPIEWNELFDSGRGVELTQSGDVIQCPNCMKWDAPPEKDDGEYTKKECRHCDHEYEYEDAMATDVIVRESPPADDDGWARFAKGESVNRYRLEDMQYIDTTRDGINYKDESLYTGDKIMIRKTGVGIYATADKQVTYGPQVVYFFNLMDEDERDEEWEKYDVEYILGVLNSRLMLYYYVKEMGEVEWKSFPYLTLTSTREFPVKRIDWGDDEEVELHDEISEKVSKLLDESEDGRVPRDLDLEVERLVHDLYDITAEERTHVWNELDKVQDLRIIRETMHPVSESETTAESEEESVAEAAPESDD